MTLSTLSDYRDLENQPCFAFSRERSLAGVLARNPLLTPFGFAWQRNNETWVDFKQRVAAERQNFSDKQFMLAKLFCDSIRKTTKPNRRHTSYRLKHVAENFIGAYVTNGAFIAAAIACGFTPYRTPLLPLGPNRFLNMDERDLKMIEQMIEKRHRRAS